LVTLSLFGQKVAPSYDRMIFSIARGGAPDQRQFRAGGAAVRIPFRVCLPKEAFLEQAKHKTPIVTPCNSPCEVPLLSLEALLSLACWCREQP
jgi:hypothetical protein